MTATETVPEAASPRGSVLRAITVAWLLAATLDIVVAVVYYGATAHVAPTSLLQGIASGVLGAKAFTGGAATALLGLACHYFIALVWTLFFFLVYPRVAMLRRSAPVTAVLYAVFVSVVMQFVVLPLSNVAHRPFHLGFFVVATVILVFTIGTPLSIVAGRYYAGRPHLVRGATSG